MSKDKIKHDQEATPEGLPEGVASPTYSKKKYTGPAVIIVGKRHERVEPGKWTDEEREAYLKLYPELSEFY